MTTITNTKQDGVISILRRLKDEKRLSYRDIASKSDGLMSERTVARLFNGQSNMTADRYQFLKGVLNADDMIIRLASGVLTIPQIIAIESSKMPRDMQILILDLCREYNKASEG